MEALFTKLLEISIIASWLIMAILVLRICFKKASKSFYCLLWAIVGFRLIFPFSIESIFSLIPRKEIIQPTIQTGMAVLNQPIIQNTFEEITVPQSFNWMSLLTNIWLIGILLLSIYSFISYYRLYKKVSICIPYKDNAYYCDSIDSPFILGIINPKIYLPSTLDESQIQYILKHEYAHLKRKDHLWKPIGYFLLTIYWFNPMIWIAYISLCKDIEGACDEYVIKKMDTFNKKMYSETLFTCSVDRKLIMACPLAFGEVGVKERIQSIVNYKKPSFWVLCISFVVCLVLGIGFLTEPKSSVSNFTFTTGLLSKEIKLNKEQKEYVLELLDNYSFDYTPNNTVDDGTIYRLYYEKENKTYTWKITKAKTYLEVSEGNKITSYTSGNTQLLDAFKQFDDLAKDKIQINQLSMVNVDNSNLIESSIMLNQSSKNRNADLSVESHMILSNEQELLASSNEVVGSKYYLVVLYQEFSISDNNPVEVYRSYTPAIISLNVDGKQYSLKDYWQPTEDTTFEKNIIERFPGDSVNDAINCEKYLEELEKENLQKAKDYISAIQLEAQTNQMIDELFDLIKPFDNGYTDEDYKNAEGEKCLHDRGTFINENISSIEVNIQSDPHCLGTYIAFIYNLNDSTSTNIYFNETNYFKVQDSLKDKGFERIDLKN